MLIMQYDLRLTTPPCDPGSERWSAFAQTKTDISPVFPYLNAKLRGAIYDHTAQVLTWRTGGRRVSFRAHEIAVSNLEDRSEAEVLVNRMIQIVNKTWGQRDQIQPSFAKREPLKALDVYRLLPGGNCRGCGQPTCFTFALKLASGQARIEACAPLFTDEHGSRGSRLLQMLESAGFNAPNMESSEDARQ
jgi:ArsR family metal-binding transcriptional regulator